MGSANANEVVVSLCVENGVSVPWAAHSAHPARCDRASDQDLFQREGMAWIAVVGAEHWEPFLAEEELSANI